MKRLFNVKYLLLGIIISFCFLLSGCEEYFRNLTAKEYLIEVYDGIGTDYSRYDKVYSANMKQGVALGLASYVPNGIHPHYDFIGYTDGTKDYDIHAHIKMPNHNVTLYTRYVHHDYRIEYVLNGGVNPTNAPLTHNIDSYTVLPEPTKEGNYFVGWYDNPEFTGEIIMSLDRLNIYDGNMTLYACWSTKEYTLTLIKNNGEANDVTKYPASADISSYDVKKTGYRLTDWLDEDGNRFTSSKMPAYDLTLSAKWEPITYSIDYVLYGGINDTSNPTQYTIEQAKTLSAPTKAGYTFMGWYDNSEFSGDAISNISLGTTDNKTYYAKYLENLVITLNSNGGVSTSAITPINLLEGDSLLASQLPKLFKEDYVLEGWYSDEALTDKIIYGVTEFFESKTIYAKYESIMRESINVITPKETSLIAQPTDVSFVVTSTVALNDLNIATYVSLTSGNARFKIPALKVTSLGNNEYQLSPQTAYTAGGNYQLEVKEPLKIKVKEKESDKLVSSVYFMIADSEKNTIKYQDHIIEIDETDYYVYETDRVIFNSRAILTKNIKVNSIISIETETTKEHYKIGSLIKIVMPGDNEGYEAKLVECELGEVYQTLDVYSSDMDSTSCVPADDIKNKENMQRAIDSNEDYQLFENYLVAAVAEYGLRNDLTSNAQPEIKSSFDFYFDSYVTNDDPELYADAYHADLTFAASIVVELSKDITATINIYATQRVICSTTVQGYLLADGFLWNLNVDYDFLLYTIFRSETEFGISVSLDKDGKTHEITSDLQNIIDTSDPSSVVGKYREYFDMNTSELEIINFQICRFHFNIKIFEFGIPIEFRVKADINSIFKGDVKAYIQRGYSISGTDEEGLDWAQHDHQQYYSLDFASVGKIGLKAGISAGLEVSFTGLSAVGRIGLELEIGAYFNYYGYGNHRIVEMKIGGKDFYNEYSGNANFYYDFGIYLAINAYVRSDIFSFDYTKNLLYLEFPLFDGGKQKVVLGYVNDDDEQIVVNTPSINLKNNEHLMLYVLDLKYGKTSKVAVSLTDISVEGGQGKLDPKTGEYNFLGNLRDSVRHDMTVTVIYKGEHGDWNSSYLYKELEIVYIPAKLNIAPEDVNKMCEIKFEMNGVLLHKTSVQIGKTISMVDINTAYEAALKIDPLITMISWQSTNNTVSIYNAISDDTTYTPSKIYYQEGDAYFTYQIAMNNNGALSIGWFTEKVSGKVGTDASALVSKLTKFGDGHINEDYYRFAGWDKAFEALPQNSRYPNGRDLYYIATYEEKIPFTFILEIDPVYDHLGKMIQNTEKRYFTASWGERLDYYYNTYLTGYTFHIEDQNGYDPTLSGLSGPTTLHGWYELNDDFKVIVNDNNQIDAKVLKTFTGYSYGENATDILNDPEVLALIPPGDIVSEQDSWDVVKKFIGWAGTDRLEYMTSDVEIYPMFATEVKFVYFNVKFNPGEGTFAREYTYQATEGYDLLRGYDAALFANSLNPTKASDAENDYTFAGWYDNPELSGAAVTDFTTSEDVTYYAAFTEAPRKYNFTAYSNGSIQKYGETIVTEVLGQFANDLDTITQTNLSKAQLDALLNAYCTDGTTPKPVPSDTTYQFSYWQVNIIGNNVELVPQYCLADGDVIITFDVGLSKYQDITGIVTEIIPIAGMTSTRIYVDNFFEPLPYNVTDYLNGVMQNFDYSYEDDNYYYFPKTPICWSIDGVNPLAEDTTYLLDSASEDLSFIALYDKLPKQKSAQFMVDTLVGEKLVGITGYDTFLYGAYGTEIDHNQIPVATKDPEQYSIYEYVFDYWYCEETKSPVVHDFDSDYTYKAVFKKQIRYITLTFNATEKGIFPSTGSNTLVINTYAGVSFTDLFVEAPIYTCSEDMTYYNYYLDGWDHYEYFIFENDSTVTAKYKKVRNQNPAPLTGINVSNGLFTEDIAYNAIPGYEYDPINKMLSITKAGLTFTSSDAEAVHRISVSVMTSDVTFKNIKLQNMPGASSVIRVAHYGSLTESAEELATINIEGLVEITTNDTAAIIAESGAIIKGVNNTSQLVVNADYTTSTENRVNLMMFSKDGNKMCGKFANLTVDINIKAVAEKNVHSLYINAGYFEISNSSISVDYISDNVTNKYVIGVDGTQSTTNPDNLQSSFTYTNCEWKHVEN